MYRGFAMGKSSIPSLSLERLRESWAADRSVGARPPAASLAPSLCQPPPLLAQLLPLVVDDHFPAAQFSLDLLDGLPGQEAAADVVGWGWGDSRAVLVEEVAEGADAVVFVDLLGVPEDRAADEAEGGGDLGEG